MGAPAKTRTSESLSGMPRAASQVSGSSVGPTVPQPIGPERWEVRALLRVALISATARSLVLPEDTLLVKGAPWEDLMTHRKRLAHRPAARRLPAAAGLTTASPPPGLAQVSSLGVTTFSLCALSIDCFHVATSTLPKLRPIERCQSILAKLAVIWVGSMTLAVPELLLWQLAREPGPSTGTVDSCIMKPSASLPESLYSLVMTYQNARMWWFFGCYFCLPILFTVTCQLVTWRVRGPPGREPPCRAGKHEQGERQLNSSVVGLTVVYALCTLPENVCNVVLAYLSPGLTRQTLGLLGLIQQFSVFSKGAVTPVLLLCVCRPLGQAFLDCCCCCCEACGVGAAAGADSKLKTEMSSSIYFHKPRESPPLLPLGTPC